MNNRVEIQKSRKVFLFGMLLLLLGILFSGRMQVQAAQPHFVKTVSATYYMDANGKFHKGWLVLDGKTYFFDSKGKMATGWYKDSQNRYRFFDTKTGVMYTGWFVNSAKQYRFFDAKSGIMYTGWYKNSNGQLRYFNKSSGYMVTGWTGSGKTRRYFNKSSGYMVTGWIGSGKTKRYFDESSGYMAIGWLSTKDGKYYFNASTGYMVTGWVSTKGGKYYFNGSTGLMVTGWVATKNGKYYFDPDTGYMATGTKEIDGKECVFSSAGIFQGYAADLNAQPTGTKTIKNLFLAALQPVGSTLYLYGGGHSSDATRVGLNPAWAAAYNSGSYAAGLDCSGYIGWSVYQVMRKMSTGWSGSMIDLYVSYGWGKKYNLSAAKNKFYPGDILAHGDHIWMVLGQCKDGSVVVLHSSGTAGPQIAGTGGEAAVLARTYMSKYSGYSKYSYDIYCDSWNSPYSAYYNSTKLFRWYRSTLADPEGYFYMTADQILQNLAFAIGNK